MGSTSSQSSSTDVNTASQNTGSSGKQKGEKTIKGCLAGSSGNYILQEKGGKKTVNLQSSQDLSAHVGHEVKLHGRWESSASSASTSSDTTSGSMASNTGSAGAAGTSGKASKDQEKTFVVDSVDMVSDQCKSGSSSSSNSSNPK
ncbi:MAG TPA: hypothetical protein VF493_23390 [Terriglobales bacterium]